MPLLLPLHAALALAGTARFDRLPEGTTARTVTEDGVTISGFDDHVGPSPGVLTAEDAAETLAGVPGFSSPGALGFGGYVPGPGAAFGQFRSLVIEGPAGADHGSVEVFEFGGEPVPVRLEAWRGTQLVATDRQTLTGGWSIGHHTLAIAGVPFDRLVLAVGTPGGDEVAYLLIDDVRVEGRADPIDTAVDTAAVDTSADTGAPPAPEDAVDTDVVDLGPPDAPPDRAAPAGEPAGCGCAQGHATGTSPWLLLGALAARRRRR